MMWSYVIIAYLSLFVLGLADSIRGPLFSDILNLFHLNDSEGAWFYAITALAGVGGGLFSKILMRKFDRIKGTLIGQLIMAMGLFGMGRAQNFSEMLFYASILGLSFGITGVSQNVLASLGAPENLRGQVLSGLHTMYGLSSFLAPLLVSISYQAFGDIRAPFTVVSFISLCLVIGGLLVRNQEIGVHHESDQLIEPVTAPSSLKQIWLGFALGCYVLAEIMVSSRLARFMRLEYEADLVRSSYFVTAFFLLLMIGRCLFIFVKLPFTVVQQMLASLSGTIICLFAGVFINPWFFVLSGLTMAPFYPLAISYLSKVFPGHLQSAVAYSIIIQSLLIVGMHLGVGALTDSLGIRNALLVGPICLSIALILILFFEWKYQNLSDAKKQKES